jgi:hypothetical protein
MKGLDAKGTPRLAGQAEKRFFVGRAARGNIFFVALFNFYRK